MRFFSTPTRLYRALALAEMVTWTLLLAGMLVKYVLHGGEWLVRIGGGLHGFTFLSYCLVTVLVAVDQRWKFGQLVLGLGSAVIPYLTVPFERHALRRNLLGTTWLLRTDEPRGPLQKVVAAALRHPVLAAFIAVVVLAGVFTVLLSLGPPTEWFS